MNEARDRAAAVCINYTHERFRLTAEIHYEVFKLARNVRVTMWSRQTRRVCGARATAPLLAEICSAAFAGIEAAGSADFLLFPVMGTNFLF